MRCVRDMKNYGDITKIDGHIVPPVDVVIGGSPCQDLSIAGKRAGLSGERSNLFMEQIRVIKEMRERGRADGLVRPRYMVWENVPGAFSSNGGEDFRRVLEETARIADKSAVIPRLEKGKWRTSGCIMGDGWSIAWRVLDAQFWGVPQRRRRIALVADFRGQSAPEILFIRESVCGDSEQGEAQGQAAAAGTGSGADSTNRTGTDYLTEWDNQEKRVFSTKGVTPTLSGSDSGGGRTLCGYVFDERGPVNNSIICAGFKHRAGAKSGSIGFQLEIAPTLSTAQESAVYDARGNGDGKTVCTLTGDHENRVTDYTAIVMSTGQANAEILENLCTTLNCNHEQPIVANHSCQTVRRLTPLEAERLQGYPDGWTDIGDWVDSKGRTRKCSDALRYKALGNSIALPPWKWVLKRISAQYERDATMASLFDGISGFVLLWEQINGKGSCLWSSEIEEFPIAVSRIRFGSD